MLHSILIVLCWVLFSLFFTWSNMLGLTSLNFLGRGTPGCSGRRRRRKPRSRPRFRRLEHPDVRLRLGRGLGGAGRHQRRRVHDALLVKVGSVDVFHGVL